MRATYSPLGASDPESRSARNHATQCCNSPRSCHSSNTAAAIAELERVQQTHALNAALKDVCASPTCRLAQSELADTYMVLGNPEAAFRHYRAALRFCDVAVDLAFRQRVESQLRACEYSMQACSSETSAVVALLALRVDDVSAVASSMALVNTILRTYPDHIGALRSKIALLRRWQATDPAATTQRLGLCHQLASLEPSRAEPLVEIASIQHQVQLAREAVGQPPGNLAESVLLYANRALERDPGHLEALRLKGQQLRYKGEYGAALQLCNDAMETVLVGVRNIGARAIGKSSNATSASEICVEDLSASNLLEAIGVTSDLLARFPADYLNNFQRWIAFCFCDRASVLLAAAQASVGSVRQHYAEKGLKDAASAVEILPGYAAGLMTMALCSDVLGRREDMERFLRASWAAEPTVRVRQELTARHLDLSL